MKTLPVLLWLNLALLLQAAPFPTGVAPEEEAAINRDLATLRERLNGLKDANADQLADARVYEKGVTWALRYETTLAPKDVAAIKSALAHGLERVEALAAGTAAWGVQKGKLVRGFVSAVDGSVQPYGVVVPAGYNDSKPVRLDVVLHGSSKPVGMSELRFMARFEEGGSAPEAEYIEVHPLGRVENCYRWAGETDVFEAIEAACRNYKIDRDRIVLRGMSMGASGTWHLGLKHPDRFVALGPYCGYVDTHRFSETPMPNFVKVGPLPWYQELGLHMLDSVDYAKNAGVVPAIAAIGTKDPFFQSHVTMEETMKREGLTLETIFSEGTGHVIDPVTHAEQMRRIKEHADAGLDHAPRQVHFVTWTLKYNRCHWIEVIRLQQHYARAEISAAVASDGAIEMDEPKNILVFAIHPPMLNGAGTRLRIGGHEINLPSDRPAGALVFVRTGKGWEYGCPLEKFALDGKYPGMQGPIDDAFTAPFLCVRGTRPPWHPEVQAWAEANLRRFAYEWARYMRGDLPVKDDTAVTEDDVRTKNLILFGDPGSNALIERAIQNLPLRWTRDEVVLGQRHVPARDHAPSLICARLLLPAGSPKIKRFSPEATHDPGSAPGPLHYTVINSGHTFHEREFAAVNYLLFPRLGDWAVMHVLPGAESWQPSDKTFPEEVIKAGLFDDSWLNPVPEP